MLIDKRLTNDKENKRNDTRSNSNQTKICEYFQNKKKDIDVVYDETNFVEKLRPTK